MSNYTELYAKDPIVSRRRLAAEIECLANPNGLTRIKVLDRLWQLAFDCALEVAEHEEVHSGERTDCAWCALQREQERLSPPRTTCTRCSKVIVRRPGGRYITDDTSLSELCDPASGATHQPVPVEEQTCQYCGEAVYWRPDGYADRGGGYSCSARPTDQPATFGKHELASEAAS